MPLTRSLVRARTIHTLHSQSTTPPYPNSPSYKIANYIQLNFSPLLRDAFCFQLIQQSCIPSPSKAHVQRNSGGDCCYWSLKQEPCENWLIDWLEIRATDSGETSLSIEGNNHQCWAFNRTSTCWTNIGLGLLLFMSEPSLKVTNHNHP